MTRTLKIVGLGGSLAEVSRSRAALRVALEGAAGAGAETTLLDLRELDLPMYNPDDEQTRAGAGRLIEACYGADGMLWSSPMYQGTISGAFKNALDWLHVLGSREPAFLHDEVIGLISAAGGTQGLQAINTMEFATRALRAWAVPYVVPVAVAARVFDREGRVQDAAIEQQLLSLGVEVVRVAERFAAEPSLHRARECDEASERVAAAAQSGQECAAILGAIRGAAPSGATVLVNENVLPEQDADQRGQILDAIMLAVAGGRERTASELGALLERAGFNRANVAT